MEIWCTGIAFTESLAKGVQGEVWFRVKAKSNVEYLLVKITINVR